MDVKVKLLRHKLDTLHQCIFIQKTLMDTIPKSKHRQNWEKYIPGNEPDADSSSDETILYDWPDPPKPSPKTKPPSRPKELP